MDADPSPLRATLRAHGVLRRYPRGAALFSEGDVGERVFLLERGWVLIASAAADGSEVVLGLRGPGEILGELSALDGRPRSGSGVAVADAEVVVAPAQALQRLLEHDLPATRELMLVIVDRLREADRRRLEFAALDTLGRVATRLLELAERFGEPAPDGIRVELPLVQQELASWCGASREATVKALRTLRGLDVLSTGRRSVTIHDARGLRQAAHGQV
jgi:CRP/FNR family transcriptional regulator, cyclic AMP receptor protein